MNDGNDGDIDFEAITEKLQLRHWRVKEHPLYGNLMANKCGEEEVVHAFLHVLQNEIFQVIFSVAFNFWAPPAVFRRYFLHSVWEKCGERIKGSGTDNVDKLMGE
jgi:hypothetical protein